MYQRDGIKEGMTVRSIDGHRLGKVYAVGESEFHIEKGLFFPKDYSVRYAEVSDIRDGEIILAHGKESLRSFSADVRSDIDPLDSGRVGGAPAMPRPKERDISWRTPAEYEALPMDRRIEGLRTEDLGDQEVSTHNTEGASASPFLTEEDRAIARPVSKTPAVDPGAGLPLGTEAPRPAMRASSSLSLDEPVGTMSPRPPNSAPLHTLEEEREVIVAEDEWEDEARRPQVRGDAEPDASRRLNFSGESDPKKRGF